MDFRPENPDPVPPPPPPPVALGVTLVEEPLVRGVGLGEKSEVPDGVDDSRRSILRDAGMLALHTLFLLKSRWVGLRVPPPWDERVGNLF